MPYLEVRIEGQTRPDLYPICSKCPVLQDLITELAVVAVFPGIAAYCEYKKPLKIGNFTIKNPRIIMHLAGQLKSKHLPQEVQDQNLNAVKNKDGAIALGLIGMEIDVTRVCPEINNPQL